MNLSKKLLGFAVAAVFSASATQQQPVEKDWTILVFLNGNNNLDYFGTGDMNEMEKVGSTDKMNVVVQWASYGTKKTKRIKVIKDTNTSAVTSPVLQDMGTVDMGSVDELVNFVKWGKENFPAKHYMIDIWNHGNGWEKRARFSNITRDVSYDDISGNRITTEQLSDAMIRSKEIFGKNVDVLGFDACLMAMGEIAGEVAASTDYLVASEETEPGDGWPYDDFLNEVATIEGEVSPAQLTAALVKTYAISYSTNGSQGTSDVTLSAFDLKQFVEMYPTIKNLGTALNTVAATDAKSLKSAISSTISFYGSDYKDFGNFLTQLESKNFDGVSANLIANARQALNRTVTANSVTGEFVGAAGLSVWLPSYASSSWSSYGDRYRGFIFDKETQWSNWIETLATATE